MPNPQTPIQSGFGAASTADDVLAGQSLSGTTLLVTGGHSGLGLATTRALARAGAEVIVAARRPETAQALFRGIDNIRIEAMDLADPVSIQACARRLLDGGRHIDALIGNAGIMACPETRTAQGWEAQFAINHLGHFALINQLWPLLRGGSRVVLVASAGHQLSGMRWNDVQFAKGYDKWLAYGQSKTANVLCAKHLDQLGKAEGIRGFALHPGKIFTPLQRHLSQQEMMAAGWLDAEGRPADSSFKTPEQGAATQVWAAVSPQLDGMGGLYCEDCDIATVDHGDTPSFAGVRPHALDPDQAERLWALSARLTGLGGPY